MLEIVYGKTKSPTIVDNLYESLRNCSLNGTLYIGYPILASAEESITVDALLITDEHGLVVFSFFKGNTLPKDSESWHQIADEQDELYYAVKNSLGRHQNLRVRRDVGVEINILTLFPQEPIPPDDLDIYYATTETVFSVIQTFPFLNDRFKKPLNAALQRVTTIKPLKKRTAVQIPDSKGAILKSIEKEIANLDQWQKMAAIETPEGPQRIRGLAGSGKTIVLALKAAYLHTQNPDWNIAQLSILDPSTSSSQTWFVDLPLSIQVMSLVGISLRFFMRGEEVGREVFIRRLQIILTRQYVVLYTLNQNTA